MHRPIAKSPFFLNIRTCSDDVKENAICFNTCLFAHRSGNSEARACPQSMEAVSSSSNANDEERCDLAELVDDLLDAESGVFRLTHWGQRSFIYSRGSPQHVRELQENGHGLYVLR